MGLDYYSIFPYAEYPALCRGGNYENNVIAGISAFNRASGDIWPNDSFRPVLATLWYNKLFLPIKSFFMENDMGCIKEV